MNAWEVGLALVLAPSALALAWMATDEFLAVRDDKRKRAEQDRQADAEWLAVLAATETPVYDQLKCEEIEKAEGWTS